VRHLIEFGIRVDRPPDSPTHPTLFACPVVVRPFTVRGFTFTPQLSIICTTVSSDRSPVPRLATTLQGRCSFRDHPPQPCRAVRGLVPNGEIRRRVGDIACNPARRERPNIHLLHLELHLSSSLTNPILTNVSGPFLVGLDMRNFSKTQPPPSRLPIARATHGRPLRRYRSSLPLEGSALTRQASGLFRFTCLDGVVSLRDHFRLRFS
jgi:hypothetical protein